ncbi:MAG: hypothetical protein MJ156_01595 [Alphaproteobacteria bacterium]|nr:hypothetical protein [Alphaproteobacteria bacterium]
MLIITIRAPYNAKKVNFSSKKTDFDPIDKRLIIKKNAEKMHEYKQRLLSEDLTEKRKARLQECIKLCQNTIDNVHSTMHLLHISTIRKTAADMAKSNMLRSMFAKNIQK